MSQFEYRVPLSRIKPHEIDQLAISYMAKKKKDAENLQMINHEFGMLVLKAPMTKEDQDAINSFVYEQILKDRIRIKEGVKAYLDDRSESKAFIERVEEIIDDVTVNS